jgi:hypothetical protein
MMTVAWWTLNDTMMTVTVECPQDDEYRSFWKALLVQ